MITNTGLSNKCLTILDFEMYDVGKDHNRSLFIVLVWLIETSSNCILQVYTIYHWSFLKIVVSNLQDLSVDCWWMNIGRNITVSSQRIYVVLFAESDGVCMNHSQNLLSTIVASPVIYVIRNAWQLKIERCTFSKYKHVEREHIWNATTVILGHISELYLIHPDIIQIQKLTSSQIKIFLDKGLKKNHPSKKIMLERFTRNIQNFSMLFSERKISYMC